MVKRMKTRREGRGRGRSCRGLSEWWKGTEGDVASTGETQRGLELMAALLYSY